MGLLKKKASREEMGQGSEKEDNAVIHWPQIRWMLYENFYFRTFL